MHKVTRSSGWGILLACVGVLFSSGQPADALAQDDSGLSPTRLKLPSGPGSLEGVGENAEANLNMGLVTYAVPFSVPAGYQGFSPSLGLSYTSAGGEGVAGIGWDIGTPSIERTTVRGLPEYDGDDVFATSGGAELVRMPGTRTYRERFEGSFVRYTWLAVGNGAEGYWKAEYPDGRVGYFGARANGTLVPEARMAGYGGTFAYYLVEMVDVFDHRIVYDYVLDGGRPYLSHIGWVATSGGSGWRYEVELTYEPRQDLLSDGKPGVEVFLAQRLSDVRVLVRGQQLRRYHLAYEPYAETGGLTRLASVSTYGTLDDEPYPIVFAFEYTQGFDPGCESEMECVPPYVETIGSVGTNFAAGNAELLDINGDALPDVIDTRDGIHRIYEQRLDENGNATFAAVRTSAVAGSGAMALSASEVQLMDLNGDGFADMVDGLNDHVLWGSGTGEWGSQDLLVTNLPAFSEDANLRTLDVDYDRQVDVVHLDQTGAWYRRNQGYGVFETTETLVDGVGLSFAEDGIQLADMNGDGMVDVVQPVTGAVFYRANLGWGRFGATSEMFGLLETLTPAEMFFTDLNGDGLTDVVVVQGTEVRYALNQNGETFAAMATITSADVDGDLPERTGEVSIRFADMNGSGSEDVVWITPSGQVTYLELFPIRPNLLKRVTNGIGKVIEMEYGSTVTHMARDGGPSAWTHRLPHPMQVLERLITYDTLSMVQQIEEMHYRDGYYDGQEHQFRGFAEVEVFAYGDASIEDGRTVHRFDVGADDRYRKGLALGQDVESAGRVLSSVETTYEDCEVAGASASAAPEVRFVCPTEQVTTVKEGLGPEEWVTIEENYVYDGYGNRTETHKLGVTSVGGGACASCEGRPVEVQGEPCDAECRGDEMHELVDFIAPGGSTGGRWILRSTYRKRTYGVEDSDQVTDERMYYDGPDFQGLAWGTLAQGVVRRTEALRDAGGSYFVQTGRFQHDEHGNVVEAMDPNGHRRTFEYDAEGVLLVHEQVELDDPDHTPYGLRMEVAYHPVHERIQISTAWLRVENDTVVSARRETSYRYDQFGRVEAIAEPGDELDTPTQEFAYELADPASRIVTRRRTVSGSEADLEDVRCFDGIGRTYQTRVRIGASEYQVSGYDEFNARGEARRTYQPYVATTADCDAGPPDAVFFDETTRDAAHRPLEVVRPDAAERNGVASVERTVYRPLLTSAWDSEDADSSSPHANTPTHVATDGLDRMVNSQREVQAGEIAVRLTVTYDALGRIRSLVDDAGNEQWQRYDLLGRVTDVNHPDSGRTTYGRDDAGNPLSRTDARGVVTRRSFDEANRLRAVWDDARPESTMATVRYDGDCTGGSSACANGEGRPVEVAHPILDGELARDCTSRDVRGREVEVNVDRGSRHYVFETRYDNANRVAGRTFPDGTDIAFSRDGLGRPRSIGEYVVEAVYDDRGDVVRVALGNGAVKTQSYDARRRLRSLTTSLPGGEDAQALEYTWDRVGNLLAIEDARDVRSDEPSEDARYQYDALYRLTAAELDLGRASEESIAYGYDRIDNLTGVASSLGAWSPAHVGALEYGGPGAGPHAATTVGEDVYGYDLAGHVTHRLGIDHEWDHLGRLTRSTRGDSGAVISETAYGLDSSRVAQAGHGHATDYLAIDYEVRDGLGTVYVFLGDEPVARSERASSMLDEMPDYAEDGQIDAGDAWLRHAKAAGFDGTDGVGAGGIVPSGPQSLVEVMLHGVASRVLLGEDGVATTYQHSNHLGTTSVESDEDAGIVQRAQAYPYGTPRHEEGAGWSRHGHTGAERDDGTALEYHGERWIDTRAGRWISADGAFEVLLEAPVTRHPIDAANPYAYAHGNPIVMRDDIGAWATGIHIASMSRVVTRASPGTYPWHRRYELPSGRSISPMAIMTAAQVHHDDAHNQTSDAQPGHAMTPCHGNREDAIRSTNGQYDAYMRSAIEAYRAGNYRLAFWQLGRAVHIAQDATSPEHEGEQEYCGSPSTGQGVADLASCGMTPRAAGAQPLPGCARGIAGLDHAKGEISDPGGGSLLDRSASMAYRHFTQGIRSGASSERYRAVDDDGRSMARQE